MGIISVEECLGTFGEAFLVSGKAVMADLPAGKAKSRPGSGEDSFHGLPMHIREAEVPA